MATITYSILGKNYAVDPTQVSAADLAQLTQLAASGTPADLVTFVAVLLPYPINTAYKILPPNPLPPVDGPISMLDPDLLDKLDMDVVGIMALAMLICLKVEREMRHMGLVMSQDQLKQMMAAAFDELRKSKDANAKKFSSEFAGAFATGASGMAGIAGAGFSAYHMGKGETDALRLKKDKDAYEQNEKSFDELRTTRDSEYANDSARIEADKTLMAKAEKTAKESREKVIELRKKVLHKDDPAEIAADEACAARLKRADDKLTLAKEEEQKAADARKLCDEVGAPEGEDPALYRDKLENECLTKAAKVKELQTERDTLVDAAKRDHPAAAAPYVQQDRDAVRLEIASKQQEKLELDRKLADLDAKQKKLEDSLADKIEGRDYDSGELPSLINDKERVKQQLDTKNAEIAALKLKEDRLNQDLDSMVPGAVKGQLDVLASNVQLREDELHATQRKKDDLEDQINSNELDLIATQKNIDDLEQQVQALSPAGPSPQLTAVQKDLDAAKLKSNQLLDRKDTLAFDLKVTQAILKQKVTALEHARSDLKANVKANDLNDLNNAEASLKQTDDEIAQLKNSVSTQEAGMEARKKEQDETLDTKEQELKDQAKAIQLKEQKIAARLEQAAAARTGLTSIGQVLTALLNLVEAAYNKEAADTNADKEYINKLYGALQTVENFWTEVANNAQGNIQATRDSLGAMLTATTGLEIVRRFS